MGPERRHPLRGFRPADGNQFCDGQSHHLPDEDRIISGGNFHGQPLAISYDFLGIALAELGNISERRIAQLIMGLRGLPEFLVANPGLNPVS